MATKKLSSIKQTATIPASPAEVYEMLMDSKKHSSFTGTKCNISRKIGGKYSAYDGYCGGENLELKDGKKIVQTWRSADFPEGHYSKITYSLAKVKGGTKISFSQTGIPSGQVADLKKGWIEFYWTPMKKLK